MLEDERRVRHPEAEHRVVGKDFDEILQQSRDVCVDVSTVSSCVFGSQPDLHNALGDCLAGPFDNSDRVVRSQLASGVPSFAVGARSQTACRQRDDFNEFILPNFRKIEHGQLLLRQQLNFMTLEGLFNDFNNSIDLGYSKNTDIFKSLQITISLRDAPRNNHWLAHASGFGYLVDELLLGRVLHCTRVKQASMALLH